MAYDTIEGVDENCCVNALAESACIRGRNGCGFVGGNVADLGGDVLADVLARLLELIGSGPLLDGVEMGLEVFVGAGVDERGDVPDGLAGFAGVVDEVGDELAGGCWVNVEPVGDSGAGTFGLADSLCCRFVCALVFVLSRGRRRRRRRSRSLLVL
jgi:hypothetical protein